MSLTHPHAVGGATRRPIGRRARSSRETVRSEAIRAAILVALSFVAIDLVLPAVLEAARSSTLP